MNRQNPNQNRPNDFAGAALAGVAIGALGGIGYVCYKLFGGSQEPSHANESESVPVSIPFRMDSPHYFPLDSKTYVVSTKEECRYAMRELKSHCDEYSVLGFDCEWVTSYSRGEVALLQLASHRGLCVLVRLSELNEIPSELKEILMDRKILKVGITPNTDARYLFEDYFRGYNSSDTPYNHIRGTLDLRFVAKMARCDYVMGLSKMSETYLKIMMDKNLNIRCSDWEVEELSDPQIHYATLDALVATELFKLFAEKIKRIKSCGMKNVFDDCNEYTDMNFTGN